MTDKQRPGVVRTWWVASRPKTLPAAIVPVVMAAAMAYGDSVFHGLAVGVAFVCAVLLQVAANFVNDYADFKKGTDDAGRIGPLRVTQAGWVTTKQMKRAIFVVFGLALLFSVYLVYRGGWPIVVIGVLAIASSACYTAGPFPLGYHGLGEVFVFLFFGPVALAGAYYVQALTLDWVVVLAGCGPGLISVAILTVNNLRDIEGDRKAGKRTLAVRFGREFTMAQYYFCLLGAALLPVGIFWFSRHHAGAQLGLLMLLFTPRVLRTVFSQSDGPSLNRALAQTGKLLLIYGLLFSIGWIISA